MDTGRSARMEAASRRHWAGMNKARARCCLGVTCRSHCHARAARRGMQSAFMPHGLRMSESALAMHGFFVTEFTFPMEGRLTMERFLTTERGFAMKTDIVAKGIAVIAAQATPVWMVMFHMLAKAIRGAVPMVPVIVVAPAQTVAIGQEHRGAIEHNRGRAAYVGDAIGPVIAGDESIGIRWRRQRLGHHGGRRVQPEAAAVLQGFGLPLAISVGGVGATRAAPFTSPTFAMSVPSRNKQT